MDKKSAEELEGKLLVLTEQNPLSGKALADLIATAPAGKAKGWIVLVLKEYEKRNDFSGALDFAFKAWESIAKELGTAASASMREFFRNLAKDDRLRVSFVEGAFFDFSRPELPVARELKEALGRLSLLVEFGNEGALVLSKAWGLGVVRKIDNFYRRITVDFRTRNGHQFSYDAACETLKLPIPTNAAFQKSKRDHILVQHHKNSDAVAQMIKEHPGQFVKEMLGSFGDMPITRLEELCAQHGFVRSVTWKAFWEKARGELRHDKCVKIPTRRAENLVLKEEAENYGDSWLAALSGMKDAKSVVTSIRNLQAEVRESQKKAKEAESKAKEHGEESPKTAPLAITDEMLAQMAERLAYSIKAARGVDDAQFAQVAFCIADLKLDAQLAADEKLAFAVSENSREYLWAPLLSGEPRYLAAARELPARDMAALVAFLTGSESEEKREAAKATLFADLPKMCFALLSEVVEKYRDDPVCEEEVAKLLRDPKAPATLVTLLLGRYETFAKWLGITVTEKEGEKDEKGNKKKIKVCSLFNGSREEREARGLKLPELIVILTHAIVLGEGRQGGETLRMQNMVRRLFADQKWLDGILDMLQPADRALFFERFQASIAWDPSTHHLIVMRMTRHAPELAARLVKKVEVKKIERITSLRSYAERQLAYEKLTKEEIPANTRRIEFAKSYGDLSENAEYQYAKDEQRALMQKESLLQKDLNEVKPVDFSNVHQPTSVVAGSVVTIVNAAGEETSYTVLGEWDNDLERGIISNKTQLAMNMLGKKVGETFELSDADGNISMATIKSVGELTDDIRAWIAETPVVA